MKARKHNGGFNESISTMKEIKPSLLAVADFFNSDINKIRVLPYTFDDRKEWNAQTYLVVDDYGVLGMISEEPK